MSSNETTHLAIERQQIILDILRQEGVVRTAELKELLKVSPVTIRADLKELERAGECEIIWGGAVSTKPATERESLLEERSKIHAAEKRRIGAAAVDYIQTGQTIFVDAGSTTVELVRHLPKDLEYLRIVTPALNVAVAASHYPDVELVMPGGVLRNLTRALVGTQTARSMEMFNASWFFLATGGFSIKSGITTGNIMEVEVKRTMARRAKKCCVLADSSKHGREMSLVVMPIQNVDVLITDTGLSDEDASALAAQGVEIIRV
ncbi:MAG: DeoR/GlpR family DNA-binding transcription regulator [Chloroflexota bacterium]